MKSINAKHKKILIGLFACIFLVAALWGLRGVAYVDGASIVMEVEDMDWSVIAMDGVPLDLEEGQGAPSLRLDSEEGRVSGYAGCNRFFGSYEMEDQSLHFAEGMGLTRMACANGMDLEVQFMENLSKVERWSVEYGQLNFYDGQDTMLVQFERAAELSAPVIDPE